MFESSENRVAISLMIRIMSYYTAISTFLNAEQSLQEATTTY